MRLMEILDTKGCWVVVGIAVGIAVVAVVVQQAWIETQLVGF